MVKMDPSNNTQDQPETPQQPPQQTPLNSDSTPTPITSQPIQQPSQPLAQSNFVPPPLSNQPIGGQPMQYNPNVGGVSIIKKAIIGVISLVLLVVIGIIGYTVYKSMQYPEENKISTEYIKALRDENYEKIDKLYDSELSKTIARVMDISERMQAIDPSAVLNLSTVKEDMYKAYLQEGEQDFNIPVGEPSRTSVTQHNNTSPKYIMSVYNVGDKKISVVLVYDKAGGSPKALLVKEGEYDLLEDFESLYKEYKKELVEVNEAFDKVEQDLDAYDSMQGDASLQSNTLRPESLFTR